MDLQSMDKFLLGQLHQHQHFAPLWLQAHCSSPGDVFPAPLEALIWAGLGPSEPHTEPGTWDSFPPMSLQALHKHRHRGVMKASRVAGSSMTFPLLKLTGKRDYHYPLLTRPLMMILLLGDWRITDRCI